MRLLSSPASKRFPLLPQPRASGNGDELSAGSVSSTANCEGNPHVTCLLDQTVPETMTPGKGDVRVPVTMLAVGRTPGWGRKGPQTRRSCDLPEVPQPLHGESPHAASGATAVLVGAASAGQKAQAGQGPGSEEGPAQA